MLGLFLSGESLVKVFYIWVGRREAKRNLKR